MNSDDRLAFTIRRAAPGDEGSIVALLRELAVYEKLEGQFQLTEAIAVRDMLGDGIAHCDLAIADGQPAGVAVWYWIYKSFRARRGLFLEDLYVSPAFRGRGIGKALLTHLARTAAGADADRVEWIVLDWNMPAIDFYRGIGARPVEDWLTYRLDEAAMKRLAVA